ncbi:hypothetical protein [Robiginitalea marina]|uniref:Uncharacterized protein n=1 Tax=Robiginitalea marina TaxID=2954105 RepID=A0ABT1AYQ0_9FLAO|nr:hypothetical protein [Robiginitalea marina]MCO5725049.1 hypothetical protein [Robiginitalea marina]
MGLGRHGFDHPKNQASLAVGFLLLSVVLGLVLRGFTLFPVSFTYKYLVHTHSHIALLGWAYLGLTTVLYALYQPTESGVRKYRILFWFTQTTLLGMLLTFPWHGYALGSILFSTLFLFASYGFFWFFLRYLKPGKTHAQSHRTFKAALGYMVLSSAGPWALGAIMGTLGPTSNWYRMAIYFYLHFQYNAWMLLALLGVLLYFLEEQGWPLPKRIYRVALGLIHAGIFLSLLLSALWTDPPRVLNVLGGVGALASLVGLGVLGYWVWEKRRQLFEPSVQKFVAAAIAGALGFKLLLQTLTALPYFATLAATHLDFTIGYLHWTFLGVISPGIGMAMGYQSLLKFRKPAIWLYGVGFLGSEALIFYRGAAAWLRLPVPEGHPYALWGTSALMALALLLVLVHPPKTTRP